jgi:hypothetical protein
MWSLSIPVSRGWLIFRGSQERGASSCIDALAINFSIRSRIVSQEDLPAINLKVANLQSSPNLHCFHLCDHLILFLFSFLNLLSGAFETFLIGALYSWPFQIPVGFQSMRLGVVLP